MAAIAKCPFVGRENLRRAIRKHDNACTCLKWPAGFLRLSRARLDLSDGFSLDDYAGFCLASDRDDNDMCSQAAENSNV
jgi:hypothetical protein